MPGTRVGAKRSGGRRRQSRLAPRAHSSKVSSSRSIFRSASANRLRRPPENSARPSRMAASRPTISTPAALSALRSSVDALGRADQLRRRQPARARQVVDLVVALIPDARRSIHHSTSRPRYVRGSRTCSPTDSVTGRPDAMDLVGQLHAGRRRADDEHAAVGQLIGIAISRAVKRLRSRAAAPARSAGTLARLQAPLASTTAAAVELAAVGRRRDSRRRSALTDVTVVCVRTGAAETAAKRDDERDHLGHRHEAVGIVAVVTIAGQPALPVRRQQPQRVPAFAAPGVGDLAAFEHHVIDRALAEAAARRQPGVAGADDDCRDAFDVDPLRCCAPRGARAALRYGRLRRSRWSGW